MYFTPLPIHYNECTPLPIHHNECTSLPPFYLPAPDVFMTDKWFHVRIEEWVVLDPVDTHRHIDTETDRYIYRQTDTDRYSQTDRYRDRQKLTDRHIQIQPYIRTDTDIDTDRYNTNRCR